MEFMAILPKGLFIDDVTVLGRMGINGFVTTDLKALTMGRGCQKLSKIVCGHFWVIPKWIFIFFP